MATRFKSVIALLALALAMGCATTPPLPAATPVPFLAIQLDVKIDPKEAATFVLNPSPLGKGGYSQGMVVTIDILPKEGWQVVKWVGPIFNIDGTTAEIQMDSSQTVAVRLKSTTPATATPTPVPTATPAPTYAARAIVVTPTPPPTPSPTPMGSAGSYLEKGLDYSEDGKYQLAINEFTAAIRLNPNHQVAYLLRGGAYHELGQRQRAIQDFDKVIQLDPNDGRAYAMRGGIYGILGQYQRAIQDFDKAIRLEPTAQRYNSRGIIYGILGQRAKADADKAKACSIDSQYC